MFDPKKILVLAPHTDDGELGCGGAIAKFCAAGKEVYYVAFSTCAQSLPAGLPPNTLAEECKKATALLGISSSRVFLLDYQVREFPAARQELLDALRKLSSEIQPELVLLPAASDIHQDHETIHREGLRAFKGISIAGYELPWNQQQFNSNFYVTLSEAELDKKIAALKCYASQSHRAYMKEDFTRSLAHVRGVQCGVQYAEAFELYKCLF